MAWSAIVCCPAGQAYQDELLREMAAQQRRYYEDPLDLCAAACLGRALSLARGARRRGAGALAADLGGDDPTQVFYRGNPQELLKLGDSYLLRLPLPHVELSKVAMTKKGDELFVEVGNFKRDIALPTCSCRWRPPSPAWSTTRWKSRSQRPPARRCRDGGTRFLTQRALSSPEKRFHRRGHGVSQRKATISSTLCPLCFLWL